MALIEKVKIEKLVYGGQGLGQLSNGKKVFLYGVLPGELVKAKVYKKYSSYSLAETLDIIESSDHRIEALDKNYLSTSPWQIFQTEYENQQKIQLMNDLIQNQSFLPPIKQIDSSDNFLNYRNKMEYVFFGDDQGLHLAQHKRGTHHKEILDSSSIASPFINRAAQIMIDQLNTQNIRASDLKSLIVRSSQNGSVNVALFIKNKITIKLHLIEPIQSIRLIYSDPKSPASVVTEDLKTLGQDELKDELLNNQEFRYSVLSFFQVNLEVYKKALNDIGNHLLVENNVLDYFSGVGSIGLSLPHQSLSLVDNNQANIDFAKLNSQRLDSKAQVLLASANQCLDHINHQSVLIVDPPRNGLDQSLINAINQHQPQQIIYLSCNPITQLRDVNLLKDFYLVNLFKLYNFFPRTPNMETLIILNHR
jgi:23S rRNA (uracil1939-C5)-methyltransferase